MIKLGKCTPGDEGLECVEERLAFGKMNVSAKNGHQMRKRSLRKWKKFGWKNGSQHESSTKNVCTGL